MPTYHAPLRDYQFLLNDVWDFPSHLKSIPDFQDITPELMTAVFEEAAKLNENILQPLNSIGDQQGCVLEHDQVKTPSGFISAFQQFAEGGWMGLPGLPQYGGQGFPHMANVLVEEMLCASNVSFHLYPSLTQGVCRAIAAHASDALKQQYLPGMYAGRWTGAMCLTESHSGTDLGLLRTKAVKQSDDTYLVSGTKIFITAGDHDLAENIIHLVLARTPDAPPGTKGISLFLVPKFLVNDDHSLGARNGFVCTALEHKMGLKGSATCVINYDNAKGFLVGDLNQGLRAMFTVMNIERLAIGLQGIGLAEVAYQNAAIYARDRLQGRALTGVQFPEKSADPIIVHPDVRRMLLTIRAYTEGLRSLSVWIGQQIDITDHHPDQSQRTRAQMLVDLFTPVIKAFGTDMGFDGCNLALQVYGGHGYIAEWGMEQFVRDARIAQLYEGANGVQALDLVRRKLILNEGLFIQTFIQTVEQFLALHDRVELQKVILPLRVALQQLSATSQDIVARAKEDPNEAGAASVDYLHLLAHVALSYMWVRMASVAMDHPDKSKLDFYQQKMDLALFYTQKLLPKIDALAKSIAAGSASLMAMPIESF